MSRLAKVIAAAAAETKRAYRSANRGDKATVTRTIEVNKELFPGATAVLNKMIARAEKAAGSAGPESIRAAAVTDLAGLRAALEIVTIATPQKRGPKPHAPVEAVDDAA